MSLAASTAQAINAANDEVAHAGPDVIALKSGCVYTLTGPDNFWYGPTGLPAITSEITRRPEVGGSGVVIERAQGAPKFRLFYVNGAPTTNVLPVEIERAGVVKPDESAAKSTSTAFNGRLVSVIMSRRIGVSSGLSR